MARILVVDDDRNLRELLALHLQGAGHDVDVAEDGVAGGYSVLRVRPDLIISDINMPYLDGLEFVALLRLEPSLRDIPVIFLSTEDEVDTRGKELGAVRYVPKRVTVDTLLSIVAKQVQAGLMVTAWPHRQTSPRQ